MAPFIGSVWLSNSQPVELMSLSVSACRRPNKSARVLKRDEREDGSLNVLVVKLYLKIHPHRTELKGLVSSLVEEYDKRWTEVLAASNPLCLSLFRRGLRGLRG